MKIKKQNVFANKIFFDEKGKYAGVDIKNPLSGDNGKYKVVKNILLKENPKRFSVFIGDSPADMKTKKIVNLFVGYGGVVVNEKVKNETDIFIKNLKQLPKIIKRL